MSLQTTHTILDRILARKHEEVAAFKASPAAANLDADLAHAPPPRGFARALQKQAPQAVIAEIKKASPSKGLIRKDFDITWLAQRYEAGGATCLSVLTDQHYFQGHGDFLGQARRACSLPVLRKDFMIDPIQIDQSRAMGADCILLIAAALSDELMQTLTQRALELDMDVLVEVHDKTELQRALTLPDQTLLGINNRDLHSFATTLATSLELADQAPSQKLLISESGIYTPADRHRLQQAGFQAFLIGESFMRQPDPGQALQQFLT